METIAIAVTETKFAESNYDKADGVVYRMIEVTDVFQIPKQDCRLFIHCCVRNVVVS